jgi:hypothetical protein
MRKHLMSERQSCWHQERVGIRAGGRGLGENGDAGRWIAAALRRTEV